LPGCVAVAETRDEVLKLIEEAIEFHLDGLRQDDQPTPEPSSSIEYVEIRAAQNHFRQSKTPPAITNGVSIIENAWFTRSLLLPVLTPA
jgi:hypothetical protein